MPTPSTKPPCPATSHQQTPDPPPPSTRSGPEPRGDHLGHHAHAQGQLVEPTMPTPSTQPPVPPPSADTRRGPAPHGSPRHHHAHAQALLDTVSHPTMPSPLSPTANDAPHHAQAPTMITTTPIHRRALKKCLEDAKEPKSPLRKTRKTTMTTTMKSKMKPTWPSSPSRRPASSGRRGPQSTLPAGTSSSTFRKTIQGGENFNPLLSKWEKCSSKNQSD